MRTRAVLSLRERIFRDAVRGILLGTKSSNSATHRLPAGSSRSRAGSDFGRAADRIAALTIYQGKAVQDKLTKLDTAGEAVRHDAFVARVP